jgi:protein arginine kinase activator
MKQICQKCGQHPATFHYQENVNGVKKEMHLCAHCAAGEGMGPKLWFSADPMFGAIPVFGKASDPRGGSGRACPRCGTSLEEIQKKGKFGCSECYDTFSAQLDLTPFVGNGYPTAPSGEKGTAPTERNKMGEVERWKAELQEALKEENYEKAAILRDQIRAKEGK